MTPELENVLAGLDLRAQLDPRLERYRIQPDATRLDQIPAGWHVSEDLKHLALNGGWWPGYFSAPVIEEPVADWWDAEANQQAFASDRQIDWVLFGSVFEADACFAPITHAPEPTSPIFMFSGNGLWRSMTFPTEAMMLQSFTIVYDEVGWDSATNSINELFPEWMVESKIPVYAARTETTQRAQAQLRSLLARTGTTHPCWDPVRMPFFAADGEPLPAIAPSFYGLA